MRNRGFSLVELMIGLTIGAVMILGSTTVFMSTIRSYSVQNGVADTTNTGRYALQYLARHIRMAGYRDAEWERGALPDALAMTNGASDTITVRYESLRGCNLAPGGAVTAMDNVFEVVGETLRCNGRTIIDGIEEMQVFAGEDTDGDGVVNRYVAPGTAGLDMDRVVAVSVNLLVVSESDNVATGPASFVFDFWNTDAADDGRLRREYSSTVTIRNQR